MAFHDVAQLSGLCLADFLTCPDESVDNERYPFFFFYLLQEQYLPETVERVGRIVEDIHHHVAFAAIEAVGYMMMLLPCRTHLSFQTFVAGQQCQLLEFVDADDDLHSLGSGYLIGQFQYFHDILFF